MTGGARPEGRTGRLEDKVAVVTGAASGIGRAATERFLAEGARVLAADLNEANAAELKAAADEAGAGDRLLLTRTDVAHEDQVEAMIAGAVDAWGRLDVLFNNAGIGGVYGPITDTDADDWDYTVGILLRGVFLGIKHGARAMKRQDEGGAIVNTASVAGLAGGSGPHAYSTCKAAVINLTRSTALELAPHRIRVNAVCPGAINTPLINMDNPDAMGTVFDTVQPWPDHGRPSDVASTVLFLVSDDAAFVTGEAVVVDGGMMAAGPGLITRLAGDAMWSGTTGVNRGSTGLESTARPVED